MRHVTYAHVCLSSLHCGVPRQVRCPGKQKELGPKKVRIPTMTTGLHLTAVHMATLQVLTKQHFWCRTCCDIAGHQLYKMQINVADLQISRAKIFFNLFNGACLYTQIQSYSHVALLAMLVSHEMSPH